MACERYRGALADAGAGAPVAAEFEAHLAACPACRAALEAAERALALADASLGELLAAEPRPALRARIRLAVSEDRGRARGRHRFFSTWGAAQAIGATLLVMAVFVVWREVRLPRPPAGPAVVRRGGQLRVPDPDRPAEAKALAPSEASASPSPGTRSADSPGSRSVRARRPAALARTASAEPEVLVPPGETETLLRLALDLQRGQVVPAGLLSPSSASVDLPGPAELEVKSLHIVPLDPSEASGI